MATQIKLNALLTLEPNSPQNLEVGKEYVVRKDGFRILPFNIPLELADHQFKFLGKARVIKLVITPEGSDITFQVLKLFSPEEQAIYSRNFIKT
ncbi:hypothetical protein A3K55_02235 [Candidatus Shapirobacteria bacterium RBG_13_44_7]|uniref:Uncharacterized protein n=1 Tax=Candidatus Shapirobacteria bacterium RBG_13_44_7 TaxID=1802149 RepID=A0A1F7SJM5_9BACT|nr:MAG: hypothetical protein A3K55_02235 [Candidatus Shapirobacteria bacterium RBG_13_44_7]